MAEKFVIRLIRDSKNYHMDDIIRIEPTSNDKYQIELETSGSQLVNTRQKKSYLKGMSFEAVQHYMNTLLSLLPIDEDGYKYVQFDMPCMPGILISTDKLECDCLMDTIVNYMSSIKLYWSDYQEEPPTPTKPRGIPPPLPAGARRHIFFDEEGEISHINTSFYE